MVVFRLRFGWRAQAALAAAAMLTACSGRAAAQVAGGTPVPASADLSSPAPTHGHSMQGDVFNEGPRQHAYLMKGMPRIDFPVTTTQPLAQRFFNQGVGQLHGFWYYEAERSFRQAAAIDHDCAMAYWGMAMANLGNLPRARDFIAQAVKWRDRATPHEQMYIDALAAYVRDDAKQANALKGSDAEKVRIRSYSKALRRITETYPDDIEAKAFLAVFLWENNGTVPVFSRWVIDALVSQVLAKSPMHPAHHYRIHLWNGVHDQNALTSAALCGQGSPGIAHLWHMPGHTYSSLHRYADAAWQQEASARTDHAYMMRDGVMPDQIGNYAHNNQWLVEDLDYVGRVRDAVDLAKNMVELPRHPKYNTYGGSGSAAQGRRRLFQVLLEYELWDELIALSATPYLEPTDLPEEQAKRLHALGVAYFSRGSEGDAARAQAQIAALQKMAAAKTTSDGERKAIQTDLDELSAYGAMGSGDFATARKRFDAVQYIPKDRRSRLYLTLGDRDAAVRLAGEAVTEQPNQVLPLASQVDVLYRAGRQADAQTALKRLQGLSDSVDMQAPIFHRAADAAVGMGLSSEWRVAHTPAADVGRRPPLASLGPLRWSPTPEPDWTLADWHGHRVSLADYRRRGRPVVVLFYLGSGCAQCVEQLNLFAPLAREFDAAGISLVAVGTDARRGLPLTAAQCKDPAGFPFPLLSDRSCTVFKRYRAYDDFERMPLHGAFLIDGQGLIRWRDVSFQPFTDARFLLDEAKRLLALPAARPVHDAESASAPGLRSVLSLVAASR